MPLKSVFFKLCQLCIAKKTIKVHIETLILYKIYCILTFVSIESIFRIVKYSRFDLRKIRNFTKNIIYDIWNKYTANIFYMTR